MICTALSFLRPSLSPFTTKSRPDTDIKVMGGEDPAYFVPPVTVNLILFPTSGAKTPIRIGQSPNHRIFMIRIPIPGTTHITNTEPVLLIFLILRSRFTVYDAVVTRTCSLWHGSPLRIISVRRSVNQDSVAHNKYNLSRVRRCGAVLAH